MPDTATLLLFATTSLALIALPGPGLMYLLSRSLDQGRRAGVASMAGLQTAEVFHIVAAAIGISALIAASATALDAIRWIGAAYLVVLGVRRWREAGGRLVAPAPPASWQRIFAQGLVVQLLNPKVAIFFLAYLPQFIDPAHPVAPQVLLLGVVYLAIAFVSNTTYVLIGAGLGDRLRRSEQAQRTLARCSAVTYVGLGAIAALTGARAAGAASR